MNLPEGNYTYAHCNAVCNNLQYIYISKNVSLHSKCVLIHSQFTLILYMFQVHGTLPCIPFGSGTQRVLHQECLGGPRKTIRNAVAWIGWDRFPMVDPTGLSSLGILSNSNSSPITNKPGLYGPFLSDLLLGFVLVIHNLELKMFSFQWEIHPLLGNLIQVCLFLGSPLSKSKITTRS